MKPDRLRFVIRTPQGAVFDAPVLAARVPTETGQVGLRPGAEPLVLALEPGLVVLRVDAGERLAATAGGLLESGRAECVLLTPFALCGDSESQLEGALSEVMATPPAELLARKRLEELEQHILGELTRRGGVAAPEVGP